jgi:hypothetical protein
LINGLQTSWKSAQGGQGDNNCWAIKEPSETCMLLAMVLEKAAEVGVERQKVEQYGKKKKYKQ